MKINRLPGTSFFIFLISIFIYWSTAFPTITWWDTGEYATAAVCLGLTGPPGSILLTFAGWLFTHIMPLNPALILNLLAGVIGASTVVLSFHIFKKMVYILSGENPDFSIPEKISFVILSLIIICSTSMWEYATMFNPYILTALFSLAILLAILKWWENADSPDSWKNIFFLTLLIGIDFSVHRTNAVLIPGLIVFMVIRNYQFLFNYKSYLAAFSGLILGLSIQLLYIPMSLLDPPMNMGETNDIQSWWDFISLKQYGGNFLTDIFVRKGPLWSYQIPYFFKSFADQYFYVDTTTLVGGYIPAILGITGLVYVIKKNTKTGIALIVFLLVTTAVSIIYFNLPENYFRTIYRHYLPVYIIFSILIFAGGWFIFKLVSKWKTRNRIIITIFAILILIISAFSQFQQHLNIRNNSNNRITYEHARNILQSVEENALLISQGDNNFWPTLYLQIGENFRPDITHCNTSLLNLEWYVKQKLRHDPQFPIDLNEIDLTQIFVSEWKTDSCNIPLNGSTKRKYNITADSFELSLTPLRESKYVLLQDIVVFHIIKTNQWKRPVYFIKHGLDKEYAEWLKPWLSDEGLVYRLIPDSTLKLNTNKMEENINAFRLDSFSDSSVFVDMVSQNTAELYYQIYLEVINNSIKKNDIKTAIQYYKKMLEVLPLENVHPHEQYLNSINQVKNLLGFI